MSLYPISVDCPTCGAVAGSVCVDERQHPRAGLACDARWTEWGGENILGPEKERQARALSRTALVTQDAYMVACRALNWRHGQLRSLGVEPDALELDCPHEVPEGHVFKNEPSATPPQARRLMPPLSGGSGKKPPQEHHVRLTVEDMGPIVANELEKAFNNLPVGAVLQKVHGYGWAIQAALKALADPGDAGRAMAILILEHTGASDGLA